MYFSQPYVSNFDHPVDARPQPDLSDANREMRRLLAELQQLPLGSAAFRQAMVNVHQNLQTASRALALGCGISSEFRYLPETWGLSELNILHGRYLTPMSYHLNTAWGASERLASGRGRPPHFPLMVGCMLSIVRLWQTLPEAIANLRRAAGPHFAGTVDLTEQTLRRMVPATQQALAITRSAVDPALWNSAVRASQLAHEVRERVATSMGAETY
jgi:hypothetical protein